MRWLCVDCVDCNVCDVSEHFCLLLHQSGERKRKILCNRESDHVVVSDQRCNGSPRPATIAEPCNVDCELRYSAMMVVVRWTQFCPSVLAQIPGVTTRVFYYCLDTWTKICEQEASDGAASNGILWIVNAHTVLSAFSIEKVLLGLAVSVKQTLGCDMDLVLYSYSSTFISQVARGP